jgi:hypothetical protein
MDYKAVYYGFKKEDSAKTRASSNAKNQCTLNQKLSKIAIKCPQIMLDQLLFK